MLKVLFEIIKKYLSFFKAFFVEKKTKYLFLYDFVRYNRDRYNRVWLYKNDNKLGFYEYLLSADNEFEGKCK
jgi:hypothetical protein